MTKRCCRRPTHGRRPERNYFIAHIHNLLRWLARCEHRLTVWHILGTSTARKEGVWIHRVSWILVLAFQIQHYACTKKDDRWRINLLRSPFFGLEWREGPESSGGLFRIVRLWVAGDQHYYRRCQGWGSDRGRARWLGTPVMMMKNERQPRRLMVV